MQFKAIFGLTDFVSALEVVDFLLPVATHKKRPAPVRAGLGGVRLLGG
jgi:hypothetical protein